jgi:hypothetical protein
VKVRAGDCPCRYCCKRRAKTTRAATGPLTFGAIAQEYMTDHVNTEGRREGGRKLMAMYVSNLRVVEIPAGDGTMVKLEDKPMASITQPT